MHVTTDGLIIKYADTGESDRFVTILTPGLGKIRASAKRARFKTSRILASTQLFAYSGFVLFENRGRHTIDSAELIEQFFGLSSDIRLYALASYFAELLDTVGDSDTACPELVRLSLNAFYALSNRLYPRRLIKAAFEMRLCADSGFSPNVSACSVCGETAPEQPVLDLSRGSVSCARCAGAGGEGERARLTPSAHSAIRYALAADYKRLFSFNLRGESERLFCEACEKYVRSQLGTAPKSLDIYRSLEDNEDDK